jgi:prefoldin subunit 5
LQGQVNTLSNNHDALQVAHNSLQSSHNALQSSHDTLSTNHNALQSAHNTLQTSHNTLQTNHNALQSSHDTLQGQHNTLQSSYNSFSSTATTHMNNSDLHDKVIRIGHTYAIPGEIKVPSGDTNYVIPFFVSLVTGQTAKLAKCRYRINSGTSVTCKLQKNGADITGYTGMSVTTTTAQTDADDVTLADNDMLALIVTAVSGTPKNMTFTLFIDYEQ